MRTRTNFHEAMISNREIVLKSDRHFGITMSIAFLIFGILFFKKRLILSLALGICSVMLALMAMICPERLKTFHYGWMKFSLVLKKITTPIILFILFAVVLTPTAIVMKIFRKDLLRLKKTNNESYWISPGEDEFSFNEQF